MHFVSTTFAIFLIVVLALFYVLPPRLRKPLLWVASYVFYATWSLPFIAVILLTTTLDYGLSKAISASVSAQKRKTLLIAGIVINLLILGVFKYCNFFLETAHSLGHWLGWEQVLPEQLAIILPLGISFYTFEAISYMMDVYRGEKPAPNWLSYNFFIMYFPHLISGPIVRFKELWAQAAEPLHRPSLVRIGRGLELIFLGYLFKVLIADPASMVVDPLFHDSKAAQAASVLVTYLGVLGFTVQIYFDFMGYTHIARGISLLFDIELPLNFNHPYLATSISNFWERWHISLSRWIRDYLYFPIGGSKLSLGRTAANLMVTMFLVGLWHGAGWGFIMWGLYHGALLSLYHGYRGFLDRLAQPWVQTLRANPIYRLLGMVLTFISVVFGWVLFRAPDLSSAMVIWKHLLQVDVLWKTLTSVLPTGDLTLTLQLGLLLVCCFAGAWTIRILSRTSATLPYWLKVHVACVVSLFCWIFGSEAVIPFLYFQF